MTKSRVFSLFEEFDKEQKENLQRERSLNSDILMVDGMNTFMRVWSMYPTTNDNGDHIGGYTGFLKSVGHAIRLLKPTRCVIVFDGRDGTRDRKKIYPEYKNRKNSKFRVNRAMSLEMGLDEEEQSMKQQIVKLVEYLRVLPTTMICIDYTEADDIVGHLVTEKFTEPGQQCTIMSTDADFLQLVNHRVSVYSPTKRTVYTPDILLREYGISAENFLTYRMIMGDTGDNIRGIYGVGDKKIKKAFPNLSEERYVDMKELTEIAERGVKSLPFYKTFLKDENQELLERNSKLMQLNKFGFSEDDQETINSLIDSPPSPTNKFEFSKKFAEDRLWSAFPNYNAWLMETWSVLNGYANFS